MPGTEDYILTRPPDLVQSQGKRRKRYLVDGKKNGGGPREELVTKLRQTDRVSRLTHRSRRSEGARRA